VADTSFIFEGWERRGDHRIKVQGTAKRDDAEEDDAAVNARS
jgi:hypothetical protein